MLAAEALVTPDSLETLSTLATDLLYYYKAHNCSTAGMSEGQFKVVLLGEGWYAVVVYLWLCGCVCVCVCVCLGVAGFTCVAHGHTQ